MRRRFARLFINAFVDTRLWKTKHPQKRFQNFRQSCVLSTDGIEIHQLQPPVWPSNLLYVMLSACDWWISIQSVNNTQDWWTCWKHYRGCFEFQSRVSTKTVVSSLQLEGPHFSQARLIHLPVRNKETRGMLETISCLHFLRLYWHHNKISYLTIKPTFDYFKPLRKL